MLVRITEAAAKSILGVMDENGLNPNEVFVFLNRHKDGCAFEFTKEHKGREMNFHGLKVQLGEALLEIVVDYVEMDGRKGLVFSGL